jgi:Flp pilus assembly protein TadG
MKKLIEYKGAAAVEFAILLPILVIILFGIVEFGVLMFNQQVITNASREGARAGMVMSIPRVSAGAISAVVTNYADSHLITFGTSNPTNTVVSATGTGSGDYLTVTVNYNYSFLVIPNFVPGFDKLRAMKAITVMRYE